MNTQNGLQVASSLRLYVAMWAKQPCSKLQPSSSMHWLRRSPAVTILLVYGEKVRHNPKKPDIQEVTIGERPNLQPN